MEKFNKFTSTAVPLNMNDVDTDMIIPAQFMTSVSRDGYGKNLFRRLRDGDADFPLNQDKFSKGRILLAGNNFGCGSSREHAVWALTGWGFKVVIAKAFADIFYNNSAKNGLLLISLPSAEVDALIQQAQSGNLALEVDLERQIVRTPEGKELSFDYDPFRKHCLLNGLDDIDYILSHNQDIQEFRERQKEHRFFSTL